MPTTRVYQRSFGGGEISPDMLGRIDDVRYQSGAGLLQNFVALPQGPAARRPGLEYVANTKSDAVARLIPVQAGPTDNSALVFGPQSIRIIQNGAMLPADPSTWSLPRVALTTWPGTWTPGQLLVISWPAAALREGDKVLFSTVGLGGSPTPFYMTQPVIQFSNTGAHEPLEFDTPYYVRNRLPNGNFNISKTPDGPLGYAVSNTAPSWTDGILAQAFEEGDTCVYLNQNYYCKQTVVAASNLLPSSSTASWQLIGNDYEIATPYASDDLFSLHYTQSNDVLTVVHRNYAPREVRRYKQNRWTLEQINFASTAQAPTIVTRGSTPGEGVKISAANINGNPPFTTKVAHNFSAGDPVYISGIPTYVADGFYVVYKIDTGNPTHLHIAPYIGGDLVLPLATGSNLDGRVQFSDQVTELENRYAITTTAEDGTESLVQTHAGGQPGLTPIENLLTIPGAYNTLTWQAVDNAARYRVYKMLNGLFGLIGEVAAETRRQDRVAVFFTEAGAIKILLQGHNLKEGQQVYLAAPPGTAANSNLFPTAVNTSVAYYVRLTGAYDDDEFAVSQTPTGALLPNSVGNLFANPLFIVVSEAYQFVDDNIAPDMGQTPPLRDAGDLTLAGNYPHAVAYFEQRRCFAGSTNEPQTIYMTRSNSESDLAYSLPTIDTDRIKFRVASRQRGDVLHLMPMSSLMMMTPTGEWRVASVNTDAMTPSSIVVRPLAYVGSNDVQPLLVNMTALYCANRGGHIRELSGSSQGFQLQDLSLRASHLFDSYDVVDASMARSPHSVAWFVSNNGMLLGMSYVPEESVVAWHRHTTEGAFESVCCIPEGEEDAVYVIAKRTVNGQVKRHVERMAPLKWSGLNACRYLDAHVAYDGNNYSSTTVTVSGASYTSGASVTVTASSATFANTDVGAHVVVRLGSSPYSIALTAYTSSTVVTGTLVSALPAGLQNTATTSWSIARDVQQGLAHLNAEEVTIFADGQVRGSVTVANGQAQLGAHYSQVVCGLPFVSRLETLPIALQMEAFAQGRVSNVHHAWVKTYRSMGWSYGLPDLSPLQSVDPYGEAVDVTDGEVELLMPPAWSRGGRIVVQQDQPLPLTVLGVTWEVSLGG